MYPSPKFPEPSWETAIQFIQGQSQATFLATAPGKSPQATIIPYVFQANVDAPHQGMIEVHLVQGDPTLEALQVHPHASILVAEPLSFIPHSVFDPLDGNRAMLLFRSIILSGIAQISFDDETIAAGLNRLIAHMNPHPAYTPVTPDAVYGDHIRRLAHITVPITHVEAKWKLAQDQPDAIRDLIVKYLAERGKPLDHITVPILQEYWASLK